jgi:predicted PP-loop superfamily ATPase
VTEQLEKRVEKLEEEVIKLNRMYECVDSNGRVWYFCGRCLNLVKRPMMTAIPTRKKVLCMGDQH